MNPDLDSMRAERDRALRRVEELGLALGGVMALIESGQLVRDIADDAKPDWGLRMMEFVSKIKVGHDALAAKDGRG